jgi:eukaryotic-like serine/threonine-protein kinase
MSRLRARGRFRPAVLSRSVRLRPGLRVGPYEVISALGSGGMAEVYRARDTRLGRDIALKVVNEVLSGDPELVRRFEQEARLTGSLNHPNLVAIHDFGLHDGAPYFVTELLEGESLRSRLVRGRIPLSTALDWAAQMASGLAAAHGKGVIHRDVKPDNVFVTGDGKVKLLDFGIAKLAAGASAAGAHGLMEDTVTPTGGATAPGAVIGTPGYMSPEQVRGEPLDARSDLFSLGAVLYEMLSGRRAFQGTNPVETGYAILHADPEALPAEVPLPVAQVVQRCLQKEPGRRFQSASDLAFALDVLRSQTGSSAPRLPEPRAVRLRAPWLLAGLALATAAVVGTLASLRRPEPVRAPPAVRPEAEQVSFRWGQVNVARFLSDGRVVFSAAFEGRPEEIFVRPSGSPAVQALGLADARLLAASPTGELAVLVHPRIALGFVNAGTLARVPSVGGIPRELEENCALADWSPTGELALVRQSEGGQVLEFPPGHSILRTEGWISHLRFSPAGDRIAVLHHPVTDDDMGEVLVLDREGHARTLTQRWPTSSGLAWSADGTEIWFSAGRLRKNTLQAVTLGGRTREIYRSLADIEVEDVARDGRVLIKNLLLRAEVAYQAGGSGTQTLLSWTDFNDPLAAVSPDGKVLFSSYPPTPVSEGVQLAQVILRGKEGGPAQVLGQGFALDLSPDGRWALVTSEDGKSLSALPTGAGQVRLIPAHGLEATTRGGRWAPDGKSVLIVARPPGGGRFHLYRLREDGSAPTSLGDTTFASQPYLQVSRDGRWAAAMTADLRAVIISLQDGATRPLPLASSELLVPQGWSREGHLWVTEGGRTSRPTTRLLRVDPRSGRVLEERIIGPADPGGTSPLHDVVLSADGRELVFGYIRSLSILHIVSGLDR